MGKKMERKYCIVPQCFNSTVKTPDKLLFYVPEDPKIREKWITATKRVHSLGPKTTAHCCEDHFDVETDMENYVKYKLVGGKLKLKKGVVPHKFACQKQSVEKPKRSVVKDRTRAKDKSKPAKLIRIPLYRVDRLAFWRRHAKLNSIDLGKVDLTRHALHPTPRAGRQWKPGTECSPEQMHMHQSEPGSSLVAPATTVKKKVKIEEDVDHETKDVELNITSLSNSENVYEKDLQAVNVKSQHEVKLELYEDHIIKEEMDIVIGPTVLQIPNIRLDDHDKLAANLQRTQKPVSVRDKDQTMQQDMVPAASKQYRFNVITGIPENLKQNETENDYNKHSHSVPLPKKTINVERQDEDNLNKCFICDKCQKKFKRRKYLTIHLKLHAGVTYDCDKCDKKYHLRKSFFEHMKRHTGTTYDCDKCDKKYTRKDSFFEHLKLHSGTTYDCDKCEKKYHRKYNLFQHMKLHSGTTYDCDKCDKKYHLKRSLFSHMKLHTGTTYDCNKCDKKYHLKKSLCNHMKLHTKTTYDCDNCDKKFTREYKLFQHMKQHSGTTYDCDKCDKKYNLKKSLLQHIKLHSGTSYYCDKCNKKHTQKRYLLQHMKLHAGTGTT